MYFVVSGFMLMSPMSSDVRTVHLSVNHLFDQASFEKGLSKYLYVHSWSFDFAETLKWAVY